MILSKKEKCLINPGSKSDKYSSSLYKWVQKNFEDKCLRVWSLQKSLEDGAFLSFNKNDIKIYEIYFGSFDEGLKQSEAIFIGRSLSSILCRSRGYLTHNAAYLPPYLENSTEITDWFWKNYMEKGRCVWDPNHQIHMREDGNRYQMITKKSRRCRWCGKIFHKKKEKIIKTTYHDFWIPEPCL